MADSVQLIIVEIIGEDDKPVQDGGLAKLWVPTLGVEGIPLLRFRTDDMSCKSDRAMCLWTQFIQTYTSCRSLKNNMIKLKGTTIYPPAVNDVLDNTPYVIRLRCGSSTHAILVQTSGSGWHQRESAV